MPTGSLPKSGKDLWEEVYNKALKGSCKEDKECAARTAWSAVKGAGWEKDKDGNWHKKSDYPSFSLAITKASFDKATGEMRWQATASDTQDDLYEDNMTIELFEDFIDRIKSSEPAPEDFRSNFWSGGMPYLSVSHYPDLDGKAVPGTIESVYIDGDQFKSRGTFSDTQLGRACFKAVCDDLYGKNKSNENKVRISIAFIDWSHRHKDSGFVFDRKSLDDICPKCFENMVMGVMEGKLPHPILQGPKEFLRGQLIHEAMTRVPVNTRTMMEVEKAMTTRKEDAESIVGALADELEEAAKLVGKSEALVIKADEEMDCAEGESEEDCRKRHMPGKITEAEPGMELVPTKSKTEDDKEEEDEEKKKDKAVDEEKKSETDHILIALQDIKSLLIRPEPIPHPLDGVFSELKSQFDAQIASGAGEEDVLRSLQEPYSAIGEAIKSAVHPKTEAKPIEPANDAINAVLQSVQQLSQQVGLLSARLDDISKTPTEVQVPVRRSIDPRLALTKPQVEKVQSATPSLRSIINRTTV